MLWAAARFCLPRRQQPSSWPPETLTSLTLLSPASATLPGFPFTLITLMDRGDHSQQESTAGGVSSFCSPVLRPWFSPTGALWVRTICLTPGSRASLLLLP